MKLGTDENIRAENDSMWKDLIAGFFYPLLKRALPGLYDGADKETEPRFLDKEFRDILNTGDPEIHNSPHFADFVLEVPLKNGGDEWILLHIEAQGPGGGNLAERMYHYQCLIYAHYRRNPAALAIITGGRRKKERFYLHSRFGTEIVYRYNNLVLNELDDGELMSGDSPIDLALYAAKAAAKSKEEYQKYRYLRKIVGLLAERGWGMDDKRDLLLFIERILYLKDEGLKERHWEYRSQLGREGKVMYEHFLKSVEEKHAVQRGMEKGMEKGKVEMARNLLLRGISPDIIAESAGISPDYVRSLMNQPSGAQ